MEALRAFKHPQEVWLQPNGKKAYFRAVMIGKKKVFVLGIVVNKNNDAQFFGPQKQATPTGKEMENYYTKDET